MDDIHYLGFGGIRPLRSLLASVLAAGRTRWRSLSAAICTHLACVWFVRSVSIRWVLLSVGGHDIHNPATIFKLFSRVFGLADGSERLGLCVLRLLCIVLSWSAVSGYCPRPASIFDSIVAQIGWEPMAFCHCTHPHKLSYLCVRFGVIAFPEKRFGRPIHITTYSSTDMDIPIRVIDQPISPQLELFYHFYQWTFFLVAWAVFVAALSATYRHLIGVSNVEQKLAHVEGGEDTNDQIDGKPSSPGRPALPVWDMALGSYRFIFVNFDRFLALAWFPIAISFIVFIPDFLPHPVIRWVLHVLTMGAYAIFAVRWHRFVLLDDHSGVLSDLPSLRNLRFLLYTLAFMWMPAVPAIIIQYLYPFKSVTDWEAFTPLLKFVSIIGFVMIFVLFRLALLLPATAIDKPIGVRGAWRKMGGNTWNLFGAFVLIIIPLVIFALILSRFMGFYLTLPLSGGMLGILLGEFGETQSFALQAVNLLIQESINLVGLAVGITVLSATHWHLVGPKKTMLTRRRRSDRQR